jgi:hypothetical protein
VPTLAKEQEADRVVQLAVGEHDALHRDVTHARGLGRRQSAKLSVHVG